MKTIFHPSSERGHANHGWLDAWHSFSFASWYDPAKVHFGNIRVLNDDTIAPARGFGMHPHDNMEIVTIPLTGTLRHSDNTGGSGLIKSGDVQIMSAGTGIVHSEMNASADEAVTLLQIWVFPKVENITPRYDQRFFDEADRKDKIQFLVSPLEADLALWINQDARFSRIDLSAGKRISYSTMQKGQGVYVFVLNGKVSSSDQILNRRDALGIWETDTFEMEALENSQLVLIEVPMLND